MMPFHQTRRNVAGIAGDRSGASTVEWAIALPVVLVILIGIWEFTLIVAGYVFLEGAVREGARYGITGYAAQGTTRDDNVRSLVQHHAGGLFDSSRLQIVTRVYPDFASVGNPAQVAEAGGAPQIPGDSGSPGMGAAGDIVMYVVSYDWQMLTGILEPFFGSRTIPLRASVVVKNEPWGAGATAPPMN